MIFGFGGLLDDRSVVEDVQDFDRAAHFLEFFWSDPIAIEEGFFLDAHDIKAFAAELDTLDQDPACKRLAWRHGISTNVLDTRMRVSEVANWIEYHVLPKRAKRGRG